MFDRDSMLKDIDALWKSFQECRAHFPYIDSVSEGATEVYTPEFYGEKVTISFSRPLSDQDAVRFRRVGHWINQNFIVRLHAIFNHYNILSEKICINQDLNGSELVDLMRRLRNYFAHTSGELDSTNPEHLKTLSKMKELGLIPCADLNEFPLSIEDILKPILEGCKSYVSKYPSRKDS